MALVVSPNKVQQFRPVIGGDFELQTMPLGQIEQLDTLTRNLPGTWTSSGRAALALILNHLKSIGVKHVHLPAYLCESILLVIKALGFEYSFYPVERDLRASPDPPSGAAVLLIHYFGWLNPATFMLRAEAGRSFHLIEDASQALLSDWDAPPTLKRLVLISPRKFGPAPLGGWCNVLSETEKPSVEIESLVWRSLVGRLARAAYLAERHASIDLAIENFYLAAFRAVEMYLDRYPTSAAVPKIALKTIAGLDWEYVARQRRANWLTLNELLPKHISPLMGKLPANVVPLGYVVCLPNRDDVRRQLASQRIFCPIHWALPNEVNRRRFLNATALSNSCLTLPIDQRYGPDDMVRIAKALKMG